MPQPSDSSMSQVTSSTKYSSSSINKKMFHGLKSRNSSTMILTNERIQNVVTVEDWKSLKNFMQPVTNWLGQNLEPEPWFYSEEYIPDDFEWDDAELPSPVLDKQQMCSLRFWLIANCMMLGVAMTIITFGLVIHGKITGSDFDSDEYETWRVYIYTLNVVAWTVICTAIHKIKNQMGAAIAYIDQYYKLIKFFETGDKSKAMTSMVTLPRVRELKVKAIKIRSKESMNKVKENV